MSNHVSTYDQVISAVGGDTVLTTGRVLHNFYNITVNAARRLRVT